MEHICSIHNIASEFMIVDEKGFAGFLISRGYALEEDPIFGLYVPGLDHGRMSLEAREYVGKIAAGEKIEQIDLEKTIWAQHDEAERKREELDWLRARQSEAREKRFAASLQVQRDRDMERIEQIPPILITPGYSFEGYEIVHYSDFISADATVQANRGYDGLMRKSLSDAGEELAHSLAVGRRDALKKLKLSADYLACNAVIGVKYDYLTIEPQNASDAGMFSDVYLPYIICVSVSGTAVAAAKIK